MNIKEYRNDIIPSYLVWRAYVVQKTREAAANAFNHGLQHPPRVTILDRMIWIIIILGLGMLTIQILRWVVKP